MTFPICTLSAPDAKAAHAICMASHPHPWSLSVFTDCLTSPYAAFCTKSKEQVIGYYISLLVADELTLMDIAVSQDVRGQGIGRGLLEHCIDYAKQLNAHQIWLEVRASNVAAIQMYKSSGFNIVSVRKGYYQGSLADSDESKEDGIMMRLLLSAPASGDE